MSPALLTLLAAASCLVGCASSGWKGYAGRPFEDSVYHGGAQKIPGRVQCAYYDFGHDSDASCAWNSGIISDDLVEVTRLWPGNRTGGRNSRAV